MLPVTEPPYPPPPPPGPNPYGQNPYGQPPYGQGPPPAQPPAGGYPPPPPPPPGQPPYGGPPSGQNPYGGPVYAARPPAYRYAGWGVRVGAYLIDMLLSTVASQIADKIFGANPAESGHFTFGDQVIDFVRGAESVTLTILNTATNATTTITLPLLGG